MISVSARLRRVFDNAKVSTILLANTNYNDSNFLYLTGLPAATLEGYILVADRKKVTLLVNVLDYEIAKENSPRGVRVVMWKTRDKIRAELKRLLKGKVVGINEGFIPIGYAKRLRKVSGAKRFVDVSEAFAKARVIKDSGELKNMAIANRIIKAALKEIPSHLKEGVTEKEIAAKMTYLMMRKGADAPSFPSIVSFGANTALPHHMPDNTRLKRNSLVLLDVGARYNNYCSDVSRTFIFKPDRKSAKYRRMMEIYRTVEEAQRRSNKAIRAGAEASAIYDIANNHINSAFNGRYKGKFTHALGHSVGIDVHDGEIGFSPGYKVKLREGMVISNEPGIYIVGFGGVRIEDDILVTKKGAKVL
ncbi:MAG TPA: Xaa-Pro peptidase family protein [Candidatus Baltobacteraceae bacterium]|nr:Xaa-Pro peptidase family protein [Candidatus Baltobacteraceae bacterium]